MFQMIMVFILLVGLVLVVGMTVRWFAVRSRTERRWYQLSAGESNAVVQATGAEPPRLDGRSGLGRWLYRAGYRNDQATLIFVVLTSLSICSGLAIAVSFVYSGLQALMERNIVLVPGGVGETFLPIVWIAPWLLMLLISVLPWLIVRSKRRRRVELVEQDLPLALELLSTLSEAGLGFDAALGRILKTRLAGRPMAEEFRMFQADLLSGRPRTESLRRLSDRTDIASVSIFVSAMVQAEQLGMGIARVLRQQADDVRARRRERAIGFANALAVKRVIPLVVCFLPGLFVWTLGPAFVQLFKMVDTFIQVRNF